MTEANRKRLAELVQRRQRTTRIPAIIAAWSSLGVSVSPLSDERQLDLIEKLAAARPWSLQPMRSMERILQDFVAALNLVVVVDWDVREHPAALIGADALARSARKLRAIYPDGFLVFDQHLGSGLIVSFDEDRSEVEVDRIELDPAPSDSPRLD